MTVVGVALLVLASTGIGRAHLGFGLTAGLPASSEPARAAAAASAGFAPGILSPTEVIVQRAGLGSQQASLAALQIATRAPAGRRRRLRARERGASGLTGLSASGITVASDGNAARFLVILNGDPLGSQGIGWYNDLRAAMPALLARAGLGGARVAYAGDTPLAQQTLVRTVSDLRQRRHRRARRRVRAAGRLPAGARRPAVSAGGERARPCSLVRPDDLRLPGTAPRAGHHLFRALRRSRAAGLAGLGLQHLPDEPHLAAGPLSARGPCRGRGRAARHPGDLHRRPGAGAAASRCWRWSICSRSASLPSCCSRVC